MEKRTERTEKMAHRKIEQELERLGLLRQAPPNEAAAGLRKALSDRVNLMVAKAAKLTAELGLRDMVPDLLRAFDRLFEDPVTKDPQCTGKNAIANALRDLDYRESPPFLRGVRHVQMEPSFGKHEDTAPMLRGICLLSLFGCNDLRRGEILRYLVDGLTDAAPAVRVEAARGLEHLEGDGAACLLRLKARLGDAEAAVVGQVFDSLLKLEQDEGIPFVARFMEASRDIRAEAAMALGSSRLPGAVEPLKQAWSTATRSPEFRDVILRALAVSRQELGLEFLFGLIREGQPYAKPALEALALDRSVETRRRVEAAATQAGPEILALFARIHDAEHRGGRSNSEGE